MWQYFIGIGFSKKTQGFLDELKQGFSAGREVSTPAHITLIPPFSSKNEVEMREGFLKWEESQKRFLLKLNQVGSFSQREYGTVFLSPESSEEIRKLYESLVSTFDWLLRTDDFVPHLTVAERVPFELIEKVKDGLRLKGLEVEEEVRWIWIYRRKKGGVWEEWTRLDFS